MERKAAPWAAEAIGKELLKAYGSAAAPIPFRVLGVAEYGIQILEREGARCFIENRFKGNPTRITYSVVVMILLIPLNDESALRRLPRNKRCHL